MFPLPVLMSLEPCGSLVVGLPEGCPLKEKDNRASLSTALGSTPYIRMGVQENGATWLECTSVGWYPEPRVEWRTPQGEMFPSASESRSPDAQGLFKVVATVVITDSSMESVSCHIWNPLLSREKEAEISVAGQ